MTLVTGTVSLNAWSTLLAATLSQGSQVQQHTENIRQIFPTSQSQTVSSCACPSCPSPPTCCHFFKLEGTKLDCLRSLPNNQMMQDHADPYVFLQVESHMPPQCWEC